MKALLILLVLFALSFGTTNSSEKYLFISLGRSLVEDEHHFIQFVRKYNKTYNTPNERQLRFDIFRKNMDLIESHNKKESSFKLKMNSLGDLSNEEYK